MIEYTPISKANSGLIKFDSKKPHILEFDIDDTDRGIYTKYGRWTNHYTEYV